MIARQTSNLPTRKLTVGSSVAAIVSQFYATATAALAEAHVEPGLADAALDLAASSEAVTLVSVAAAIAAGWLVPDAPNVPVSGTSAPGLNHSGGNK